MKNNLGVILAIQSLSQNQTYQDFNKKLDRFLKTCQREKINYWQILPIHQREKIKSKINPSPYQSFGLGFDQEILPIDYPFSPKLNELQFFYEKYQTYLKAECLFQFFSEKFKSDNWLTWPQKFKIFSPLFWKILVQEKKYFQAYLIKQWQTHHFIKSITTKAKKNNIKIIADLSFYPTLKSPLVWQNSKLFEIDLKHNELNLVSGVSSELDDKFGQQIWGHPLYSFQNKLKHHQINIFFQERVNFLLELFDGIRIDHGNGFWKYSQINLETKEEKVLNGPGKNFLQKITNNIKNQNKEIFLETVFSKNKKINQEINNFHFNNKLAVPFIFIHNSNLTEIKPKHIIFSSTHDTQTLRDYLKSLSSKQLQKLCQQNNFEFVFSREAIFKKIIEKIKKTPAKYKFFTWQDLTYQSFRLNHPGTPDQKNWQFNKIKI
jgi:4-alpha-glucanotransferase